MEFLPCSIWKNVDKVPVVVADGTVLAAKIGATVAAATGLTVLKIDFCGHKFHKFKVWVTIR